jgi:hypothetical protein
MMQPVWFAVPTISALNFLWFEAALAVGDVSTANLETALANRRVASRTFHW